MGFILKKIISMLLMPLSIGLILGLIGLWYLYKENLKKAKIFITVSLVWIAITAYVPFSNMLLSPLENSYARLETVPKEAQYILLLGGDSENRGWEALRLYHLIPNAKIITSGYEGRGEIAEAIKTAEMLQESGIPKEDIIINDEPKDTKEEAKKIKELLGIKPFILVTSAYHMPRALALFKKEGLNPVPAPTDLKVKESDRALSLPGGGNLKKTELAWHEYLGLLWAKLRGHI